MFKTRAKGADPMGPPAKLNEYSFRMKTRGSLLMRFTRDNPEHKVVISLLRDSAGRSGELAMYTFLGPRDITRRFLDSAFTDRYGAYTPLADGEGHLSVEVASHLLPTVQGQTPEGMALDVLGRGAVFLPMLVQDGWLHIHVLSADHQGGARFESFLGILRNHMPAGTLEVYSVREYRPESRMQETTRDLTVHQQEAMAAAYEMGYWNDPMGCDLDDIARHLDVSKAAVHKSLAAGERKIMATFFADTFSREKRFSTRSLIAPHASR